MSKKASRLLTKSKIWQYQLEEFIVNKKLAEMQQQNSTFTVNDAVWSLLSERQQSYKLKKDW